MHWYRWDRLTRPKDSGGMGFRDLHLFNLAMLGKQGWRLLVKPESLCARVLKGRYYHDCDFLAATRKKHASHTWHAILAGKEVLQRKLVPRISNGETTHIWCDRWLPGHFGGRPVTIPDEPQVQMVADLISPSGGWNEELIKDIFPFIDEEAILRIKIGGGGEDSWAWEPEKHGLYSVKSTYRLIYQDH